jgi:hypothetical protein
VQDRLDAIHGQVEAAEPESHGELEEVARREPAAAPATLRVSEVGETALLTKDQPVLGLTNSRAAPRASTGAFRP